MNRHLLLSLLLIPLISACGGDPVLEAAREEAAQQGSSGGGQPGGGPGVPGVAGAPSPGVPEEPKPGDPNQPPPGEGGAQAPTGPTVTLKGKVVYADYKGGPIRIDLFDGDHSNVGGPRPGILSRGQIDAPGEFEIKVAQGSKVWVSASNDEDDDGRPSPLEPFGDYAKNPLVADEDVSGIEVTLSRREPPKDKQ